MQLSLLLSLASLASASSISEYYYKQCGGKTNFYFSGSTPVYCNTQQGASIGYTLDNACSFKIFSDTNCKGSVTASRSASKAQCVDFPATGGSWQFFC